MNNPSLRDQRRFLYERFIKDLEKLPVRDAVFHNYNRSVTQVIEADKVSNLIRKYAKKSLREKYKG